MSILQGTTPKLEIEIPEEFPVSSIEKVELFFRHQDTRAKYGLSDVTLNAETNTITYNFTESETLAMNPKFPLFWQLRVKVPAGIVGTEKKQVSVLDLMSEEPI